MNFFYIFQNDANKMQATDRVHQIMTQKMYMFIPIKGLQLTFKHCAKIKITFKYCDKIKTILKLSNIIISTSKYQKYKSFNITEHTIVWPNLPWNFTLIKKVHMLHLGIYLYRDVAIVGACALLRFNSTNRENYALISPTWAVGWVWWRYYGIHFVSLASFCTCTQLKIYLVFYLHNEKNFNYFFFGIELIFNSTYFL